MFMYFHGILTIEFFKSNPSAVFVFGANTIGIHGAGAAEFAHEKLWYPYYHADELIGQAYGLSTKELPQDPKGDINLLDQMMLRLKRTIKANADLTFYITAVGCGIARLNFKDVSALINKHLSGIDNVIISNTFEPYLKEETMCNVTQPYIPCDTCAFRKICAYIMKGSVEAVSCEDYIDETTEEPEQS